MRVDLCSRCGKPHGKENDLGGKFGTTETVNVGYVRGVGKLRVDITVQPMHENGSWISEGNICRPCRNEIRRRAVAMTNLLADAIKDRMMAGPAVPFDEKGTVVEAQIVSEILTEEEYVKRVAAKAASHA